MSSLPVIDLAPVRQGDADALAKTARLLDETCRANGIFYVTGHGVSHELRQAVFEQSKAFFDLPLDIKSRWHIDQSGIRRGYDPVGWQSLEVGKPADLKESFYLGLDRGPDDALVMAGVPNQGPNQWPDELLVPGFRATTNAYDRAMASLGRQVLSLLAESLNLPFDYFDAFLNDLMPVLRLLHYPPCDLFLQNGQVGSGAHTDWSNDRWRSNLHRVLSQPPGQHRYSVAYFYDMDYHAVVRALPGCFDTSNPPKHLPITAGAHC